MIRVALRGLAGRKFRAALTALAIVLGVAMISGTYVLTDTIDRAFDRIFVDSYAGTDAVVTGKGLGGSFEGEPIASPPVPADVLEEVKSAPSVDAAVGSVIEESAVKIIDREGDPIVKNAPTFGFGLDASVPRFNPLELRQGRWPSGANEVVIDSGTAEDEGYNVGDRVPIATFQPVREFEVVGIAQYGGVESIGGATFAVFDLPTAQRLLDRENQYDAISVAAKPGLSPEELAADLEDELPTSVEVRTGTEQADEDAGDIATFVTIIRYFLLTFGFIALFVGAFVIFNTLSITVAQRTRELATLRTLGASRRQVRGTVLLEALVIGALASVVGLFAGLGLASGLNSLFRALELELPTTSLVFSMRTVIVALAVGILVTVVAGLAPAIRATRVPPIAAVREGATLPPSRMARYWPYVAAVLVALAVVLLGYALFVDEIDTVQRLLSIGGGVLLLFIGVAMLSPKLVRPLASLTSPVATWAVVALSVLLYPITLAYWLLRYAAFSSDRPASKRALALVGGIVLSVFLPLLLPIVLVMWVLSKVTRFEPEWPLEFPNVRPERTLQPIARENARRNPGRTAATAAALMIGIALVTFVAVLTQGLRESNSDAITKQIRADYVITSQDGYSEFVAGATDAVETAPNAALVTDVREDVGRVAGSTQAVTGIDPARITEAYAFDWKEGNDAVLGELGRFGAIVGDDFADDKDLTVGERFSIQAPSGKTAQFEVKGIYEPPPFYPLLGAVSIPKQTWDATFEPPRNRFIFVNVPGDPTEQGKDQLEAAVAKYPDTRVQTRQEWIDKEDSEFQTFLAMIYVLLALSVIVSIFGIINTLVLSVFERTRELGMERAVGMTRRQVRRMIRQESVITALIGAALGLPLGIFLAALVTRALGEFDVQFAVPTTQLIVFAFAAILVGMVAALMPARRAARLNVLQALQYE